MCVHLLDVRRHLVDFQRVDLKVCVCHILGIISHKVNTGIEAGDIRSLRASVGVGVDITGPCTTKVDVENDAHVGEMTVNVAAALSIYNW